MKTKELSDKKPVNWDSLDATLKRKREETKVFIHNTKLPAELLK